MMTLNGSSGARFMLTALTCFTESFEHPQALFANHILKQMECLNFHDR